MADDTNKGGWGKIWGAVAAFVAAPFALIALNFDLETAWHFVWIVALIVVSPVVSIGLTDVVDAATEGRLSTGHKILVAAALGGLPTMILGYPLSHWFPSGWYGVVVFWLLLCSLPPILRVFVPVLRQGALTQISRELGTAARQKMVKAEGKPARLIGEDEPKQEGEKTVIMDETTREKLGLPPLPPEEPKP